MKISLLLSLTFLIGLNINAQQLYKHDHDCAHHSTEIALASTLVYFPSEKAFAPGIHAHYVYNLPGTRFGLGLGYEKIFDDHNHNTIGFIVNFRPVNRLSIMVSPGVTLATHDKALHFSTHFETSYEFVYKKLHFGPVLGIGWDGEDFHIGAGIHFGLGF